MPIPRLPLVKWGEGMKRLGLWIGLHYLAYAVIFFEVIWILAMAVIAVNEAASA